MSKSLTTLAAELLAALHAAKPADAARFAEQWNVSVPVARLIDDGTVTGVSRYTREDIIAATAAARELPQRPTNDAARELVEHFRAADVYGAVRADEWLHRGARHFARVDTYNDTQAARALLEYFAEPRDGCAPVTSPAAIRSIILRAFS